GVFGEQSLIGIYCMNASLMPDRTPSPALKEYKKIIEPVHTRAVDLAKGIIQVESKYDFISLDHLTLHFAIEKDGEVIQSGTASVSDVGARETKDVALDYHLDFEREAGTDYYVTISYMINRAMPW